MPNVAPYNTVWPAAQSFLQAAGINATIKSYDSPGFVSQVMAGGWTNGLVCISAQVSDPVVVLVGAYNPARTTYPSYQVPATLWSTIQQASSATTSADMQKYSQQSQQIAFADATVNWLFEQTSVCIARKGIIGHGIFGLNYAGYEWTPGTAQKSA